MAAHLSRRRLVLTAAILALGPVVPGSAVELDPSALVYKLPDQIEWKQAGKLASGGALGDPRARKTPCSWATPQSPASTLSSING